MAKVQVKRLQKLADLLKIVPHKRFDMSLWADSKFCTQTKPSEPFHNECKTAACACGWACTIPSFKRAGLYLDISHLWSNGERQLDLRFKEYSGMAAAEEFFGISDYAAEYLFGTRNTNSPKAAAKRIKAFLKQYAKDKASGYLPMLVQ